MFNLNRKDRRKIDKNLKKLQAEEQKQVLLATQGLAIERALKDVAPQLMIAGVRETYKRLFSDYVSPCLEAETATDKEKYIIDLLNHIANRYQALEEHQQEESSQEEEENNV